MQQYFHSAASVRDILRRHQAAMVSRYKTYQNMKPFS
ncbi:hypothetical protein ACT691_05600 [Vibrio metschnikovii]